MAETSAPTTRAQHWLERQHPEYKANVAKWRYARDVYTGALLDPEKIATYLLQKAQGETDQAFRERVALADFSPYFASIVDAFVGMLANVDDDAARVFSTKEGRGLGDPTQKDSIIGALYQHADNEGRPWPAVWDALGVELGVVHGAWCVADTAGERRAPRINIVPLESVPWWRRNRDGSLVEALVEEAVDTTLPIVAQRETSKLRQFVHYELTGWTRYVLDTETGVALIDDMDVLSFESPGGEPALPIYRSTLLMKRPVGYLTARKNVSIFNKQSELDALLRACGFPKLAWPASAEDFKAILTDLMKGVNVYKLPEQASVVPQYVTPPSEPAKILIEVIKEKVEALYVTAAKEYGDAARQRTATEVRQDVSSGAGAFLHAMKGALDAAENHALWRIEQLVKPTDRRFWFVAHVERSNDFLPPDGEEVIEAEHKRVFGADRPVPMGLAAQVESATRIARNQGLPVDEKQLTAAVKARAILDVIKDVGEDAPIPASVRAQAVVFTLESMGIDTAGVLEEAKQLAEAQDERRQLESQTFPSADPGDDPEDEDLDEDEDRPGAGAGAGGEGSGAGA